MFEDSLVEMQLSRQTTARRWTMLGSVTLQAAVALTLVSLPLLHPERLSFHADTPLVFTPPPPRPPIRVEAVQQLASSGPESMALPSPIENTRPIIDQLPAVPSEEPPLTGSIRMDGGGTALPTALVGTGSGTSATTVSVARPEPPKRVPVSSGVSAGLLLSLIRPLYPAIARAAGVSGSVVVEAIISRSGTVESLHVVSGPDMLRAAALDALRTARYRPYMLNGEPTEVQTTFTVNFKLGS